MLDNCDKSAIHLFFNQPMATDNKRAATLMASNGRVMEKAVHHQDQPPLKCPRCDSANTKFCYYNNYSLSQPRHFCKACKRYWTRGGTLRNVPVGGGYRKNKKVKKSGGSSDGSLSLSSSLSHPQIDSSSSTSHINQLLYGLPNNNPSSFTNFPFQRFNSRGSNNSTETLAQGYGALGLNFPSSSSTTMNRDEQHDFSGAVAGAGFNNHDHNNQIQDLLTSSNSILSNLSLLGSSTSSYATNASLIASTLQKQKQVWNGFNLKESRPNGVSNNFQGLLPFENLQMGGVVGNSDASMVMDMVKMEQGKWRVPYENHHLEQNGNSDTLYWNSTTTNNVVGAAAWPDLANYGSSVTPLI